MKLSKLNRGALFSLFVVLCVAANIIFVSAQRKEWRSEIQALVNDYLSVAEETLLLPKEYRTDSEMSEEAYSASLKKIEEKLKPLCVENEVTVKALLKSFDDCLETQLRNDKRISDLKVELIIKEHDPTVMYDEKFLKDSAKMGFRTKVSCSMTQGTGVIDEMFFMANFQRVNGEWKIANIDLDWTNDLFKLGYY